MTLLNGAPLHAFLSSCPPDPGFPVARCRTCRAPLRSDGLACTGVGRHPTTAPALRYYCTWTGTAANLAEMHARGMRVLTGPDQLDRRGLPPLARAVDNGAWACHTQGRPFDGDAFRRALARWGGGADWIVLPDVVAGGLASLELSLSWLEEVAAVGRPMLLPVQDGMTAEDVRPHVGGAVGIFVGGLTEWKERTAAAWGELARERGCHLHVGRVNSARRMQLAIDAGADSADGTSVTKWGSTAERIGNSTHGEPQIRLPLEAA
jgi:hypothetical protein